MRNGVAERGDPTHDLLLRAQLVQAAPAHGPWPMERCAVGLTLKITSIGTESA